MIVFAFLFGGFSIGFLACRIAYEHEIAAGKLFSGAVKAAYELGYKAGAEGDDS